MNEKKNNFTTISLGTSNQKKFDNSINNEFQIKDNEIIHEKEEISLKYLN